MHPLMLTMRSVLLGTGATVVLVAPAHAQTNDSIRGAPSEANHFIETPDGWEHPKTPWGEPDIEANLNMMQAAGVPLERCANSYRPGAPPCDMNKQWLTEQEYNERVETVRNRGDRSRQLAAEGNIGGAMLGGPNRSQHSAAADESHRRSAGRAAACVDRGGQAPCVHDAQRLGPTGRGHRVRERRGLR